MRAAAMTEADVVLLIGRKLDYQVGYGSPAVFPNARFIRIADTAGELIDNRRGQPELLATPRLALAAMVEAAGNRAPAVDKPGPTACGDATASASRRRGAASRATRQRRQDPSARDLRCDRRRSPIPTTSPSPTAAIS